MLKRTFTILTILTAVGLAAPGFAVSPPTRGISGIGADEPVDVAKGAGEEKGKAKGEETVEATGEEKGKAKGEETSEATVDEKGEAKGEQGDRSSEHQDKHRGEEGHKKP